MYVGLNEQPEEIQSQHLRINFSNIKLRLVSYELYKRNYVIELAKK